MKLIIDDSKIQTTINIAVTIINVLVTIILLITLLIILAGCSSPKSIVHKTKTTTANGDVTTEQVQERTPQMDYYKAYEYTIQIMMEFQKYPIEEISFTPHYRKIDWRSLGKALNISKSDTKDFLKTMSILMASQTVVYTPKIIKRNKVDWNSVIKYLMYTPTSGENWRKAFVKGLKNLGIPLAIGSMAATAIQSNRTLEEIKPIQTSNTSSGGDTVMNSGSPTSPVLDDSYNPTSIIEESYNTQTQTINK